MTICKPEGESGGSIINVYLHQVTICNLEEESGGSIINVYLHQGQGGGAFALQSIDLKLEGREVSGCGPAFFIGRRLRVARRTPAGEQESC